ncbi:MAG: hybrid sensor histidine kinase/response regulator [Elainellaceae cyanobacterium]
MNADSSFYAEAESQFMIEAQDLLVSIEQGLMSLAEERSTQTVHQLMRSAHTLKGAAASLERGAVMKVAHALEDVFKSLYRPELELDAQVKSLLFEGYECLRLLLTAEFTSQTVDEADILNRIASIIAQLQDKWGDDFTEGASIPTSEELGFDIVASIFESGITDRLNSLNQVFQEGNPDVVETTLRTQMDVFIGLAESLNLPGFKAIAQTTLDALDQNPGQVLEIAQWAIADLSNGRTVVLAGDRTQGGTVSAELQHLAAAETSALGNNIDSTEDSTALIDDDVDLSEAAALLETWGEDILTSELSSDSDDFMSDDFVSDDFISFEDDLTDFEEEINNVEDSKSQSSELISFNEFAASLEETPEQESSSDSSDFISFEDDIDNIEDSEPQSSELTASNQIELSLEPALEQTSTNAPTHSYVEPTSTVQNPTQIDITQQSIPVQKAEKTGANHSNRSTAPSQSRGRPMPVPSIRVQLDQLKYLDRLTGELLISQNKQADESERLRLTIQHLAEQMETHLNTIDALQDWVNQSLNPGLTRSSLAQISTSPYSSLVTSESAGYHIQSFDALEMDQYTKLHLMLQTLVEEASYLQKSVEVAESSSKEVQQNVQKKKRLIKHVWENVTATRMQSLDTLLNRFPQVLKQLSSSFGKDVKLEIEGASLLLDKWVVEKLYDPLLHLIRNSFDHGIEPSQERQKMGKSEWGGIRISAYNEGQYTVIEVRDDGRGIDLDRVKHKAETMGLATSQQLQKMSQQEILQFVFQPGFSTSPELNDLSGRGIGLDVVRSQLDMLNGHITLHSIPNQGTTFSLQLPLSLTVFRLLLCRAHDIIYAVPEESIERIIFPNPEQIQVTPDQRRILHWKTSSQDTNIRLLSLAELLHYSKTAQTILQTRIHQQDSSFGLKRPAPKPGDRYPVLLLTIENQPIGVEIDAILSEEELVIRPLMNATTVASFIHGCCFFGNNQLALVIDILTLIQNVRNSEDFPLKSRKSLPLKHTPQLASNPEVRLITESEKLALPGSIYNASMLSENSNLAVETNPIPLLLVVDDSPTIRQTLTTILNRANYSVTQATDGLDAISKLNQNPNVKAIICDLEMPVANGFQFLENVKKNPSLANIPVIVLTSRSSNKHRNLAVELGASEYLTKPCQHDHLLQTIEKTLNS